MTAPIETAEAQAIVDAAIDRYLAKRHAAVTGFVDANFSLVATLDLHRHAFGLDLLRAPANVVLMVPYLLARLLGAGLRRLGMGAAARQLSRWSPFLETDVGAELTFRLYDQLLQLPYDDGRRRIDHDALASEVLADPRLASAQAEIAALLARRDHDPATASRIRTILGDYAGTRNAAADLVNNALLASAGAAIFQKLTPGALTLGPVVAAALAHQAAVASFPLGAGLGGLWYSFLPVAPSLGLVASATGGLILAAAALAAFAGVVSDPVQRAFGLHQRRLHRLIDALGATLKGDTEAAFRAREHYVARIFDIIDLARSATRF